MRVEYHRGHQVVTLFKCKDASRNNKFLEKTKGKLKIPALQYSRVPLCPNPRFGVWGCTLSKKSSKRGNKCLRRDCGPGQQNSDSIATTVEHCRRWDIEGRTGAARGGKKTGSTGRGIRVEKGGRIFPPKNRIKETKRKEKTTQDQKKKKSPKGRAEGREGEEGKR